MGKSQGTEDKQPSADTSIAAVGQFKVSRFSFLKTKKILPLAIIVIAFIGLTLFIVSRQKNNVEPAIITDIPSEEQAIQNELTKLQSNKPADNASLDTKVQYYEELSFAYADSKNYQGAVEAFLVRQSLRSDDLDSSDFLNLASYYHELGDKAKALAAIDVAIEKVPPQPDPETGYDPDIKRARLNQIKQEYSR